MTIELEDNLRVIVGDGGIGMVVVNLVQNALHAMPCGGDLVITGQRLGKKIKLVVKDTGEGISPQNLARIFLPFWTKRADDSSGRGLGLSICKAIIDRIGGTIKVDSVVNAGTRFTILFPDADSEGQNP